MSKTWSWCINDGLKIRPQIHAFFRQKSLISPIFVSQELGDEGAGRLHEHGRLYEWIQYIYRTCPNWCPVGFSAWNHILRHDYCCNEIPEPDIVVLKNLARKMGWNEQITSMYHIHSNSNPRTRARHEMNTLWWAHNLTSSGTLKNWITLIPEILRSCIEL